MEMRPGGTEQNGTRQRGFSNEIPASPLIEFRNISRKFGDFYSNRDICLNIDQGEIHAVVGENGAGKTTLMNVLFGRLRPDSGSLVLRGAPISFRSPCEAIRAGIGMVHQDILFFPQLSVLENIVLGCEPGWPSFSPVFFRSGPARKEVNRIQDSLGFNLELDRQAGELSFAQRQQVELIRVLYRGAEILILDEPTSLLSPEETRKFLGLMQSLRAGGRTVLFISHRLVEVLSIADRITVLRKGRLAATLHTAETNIGEIARLMVGAAEAAPGRDAKSAQAAGAEPEVRARRDSVGPESRRSIESFAAAASQVGRREKPPAAADLPVLETRNLGVRAYGTEAALRDISISVRKGEIFGLGGIVGNGQRSFARVLAGKIRPDSGRVLLEGIEISSLDLAGRLGKNIRWLPENPVEEALLPERPLWESFLLGRSMEKEFSRAGFIRKRSVMRFSEEQVRLNNIEAPGMFESPSRLSGGNRQKVALARVLSAPPLLAILEQPCRGLDFGSAQAVYDRVKELSRNDGVSFIFISYDFEELISICDRIAIIFRGEIMGTGNRANVSCEFLGRWATGVRE